MSSYSRLILLLFLMFTGCANAKPSYSLKKQTNNDALILLALDYELNNQFASSATIYEKLYNLEKKSSYLNRAINNSFIIKDFKLTSKLCLENLGKFPKYDEKFYRLAIISLLREVKLDKALEVAQKLLEKYNNTSNYDILGNVYYARGEYKKAIEYFESAYASNQKASVLVSLVNVLYVFLDEKNKAISYLETFIRLYGCQEMVCDKLISFYQEEQNIDGMISILKMSFKKYKDPKKKYKNLIFLIDVLEARDINEAIKFLEENPVHNVRLMTLYEKAGEYKKALALVRKIYRKTKRKELLGQIAILSFELAKDKKAVMNNVIANFELAIKATNNASYKNYYGYILIEYDLDVKKGLKLVKEALESSQKNLAYMDSVAWGYYKLGNCKKAFSYMKRVVDQAGLENKEIKLHWEKVQECRQKY